MLLSGPLQMLNVREVAVLGNATCFCHVRSAISWVDASGWGNPLLEGTEDKPCDGGTWKGHCKQKY